MPEDLILQIAVAATIVLAGLIHGALGLGFPMVATPIIAIFLDVRLAILLTLLPTATVNIASIRTIGRNAGIIRQYGLLILCCIVGSVIGSQLLVVLDPDPFRVVLALLILLFLWASYSARLPSKLLTDWPRLMMLVCGLAAGLSAGTTNVMVAVLIVYFLSLSLDRGTMVPVMNACFLSGKVSQIVVFALAGVFTMQVFWQTLPLAGLALGSLLLGERLGKMIDAQAYKVILHVVLVILAFVLIWQFIV